MADRVVATEKTRQAIEAAESGDIEASRALLAEALTADPDYELAWLWFAAVTDDVGEERFCLERARDLDPTHRTSPALARLRAHEAVSPAELTAFVDPPPPDFITGYAEQARSRRRRRAWIRTIAVVVALALVAGVIALIAHSRVRYTDIAVVVANNDAGPLNGQETIAAAQWAVDTWNRERASSDRQLRLTTYYDNGDPAKAREVAQQIVAEGKYVAVIGHSLSSTSLAAAPIYAAAHLPAITPSATADSLTADNPWYFRTIFDNAEQGRGMAVYAHGVLKDDRAIVISSGDPYGTTLRNSFVTGFSQLGTIQADLVVSADPAQQAKDLQAAAARIASIDHPGIIAMMLANTSSSALAVELKKRGVDARILASDALATPRFFQGMLPSAPAAVNQSYASTPLTEGTLSGAAVTFYDAFGTSLGYTPSWEAGLTYDAVNAVTGAMIRGEAQWGGGDIEGDRQRIRDALDSARDAETALPVLTGGLYFSPANAAVRPVAFADGRISPKGGVTLHSAAYQLSPYSPSAGVTLQEELAAGTAITSLGQTYTVQRVVTVGLNFNQVDDLSAGSQTFEADFFVWFKFRGSTDGPSDVSFVNAVNPGLSLGAPQRVSVADGEHYELYRVKGNFRTQMDFTSFPFDTQQLPVTLQNRSLPAAKITYIPDPDNLEQPQSERLQSGTDASTTIDSIPNWEADSVQFYPSSVGNTGALGDPSIATGAKGITYSQMVGDIAVSRDVRSFLIKNLLPLILLTLVVYVSLWYPYKDATARISFGVTGILTGAVMLNSVTSSLPSVDYTVAIEWAYYAFILLSGLCILGTLIGRQFTEERKLANARVLDRVMRIGYPVYIAAVAGLYIALF